MLGSGTTLARFKRSTEVLFVKKQIILLLGLVLIGTLGLAAGIEASKGNWDYRSLLQARGSWQSTQATTPPQAPKPVSSSLALPQCQQEDSAANPFVQFVLHRTEGQRGTANSQATCVTATEKEKTKTRRLSFCLDCPKDHASETGLAGPSDPQSPLPFSEPAPSHPETIRFIG